MVKEFLKIAGVKTQAEFYKKYPTEAAFFKAHPSAKHLKKMAYGGINAYGYGGGYPSYQDYGQVDLNRGRYMDNEQQYQADMDAYLQSLAANYDTPNAYTAALPVVGPPQTTTAAAVTPQFALNPYQGVSVYDMLTAQGKTGDYQSRKELAKTLGIANYKGTAGQNAQMMEMIRQNPNVLSNYMEVAPNVSRSNGKKVPSTSKVKKEQPKALPVSSPLPTDLFPGIKTNPEYLNYATNNQSTISSGKGPITKSGKGKKIDPYERIIEKSVSEDPMVDETAQRLFRDAYLKSVKKVGVTMATLLARQAVARYFRPQYLPYNPYQLPAPNIPTVPGARSLPFPNRGLPYSTPRGFEIPSQGLRSPGYPMFKEGGEDDYSGTYSGGVYYQAGGSYNPTSVDYGPGLPLFNVGATLPEAMYGMGMRFGGPTYSKMTQYNHQQYVPAFDWMQDGGSLTRGGVYDVSEEDVQDLINQGYTIEYL